MKILLDNIPVEMREQKRWVVWRNDRTGGRLVKTPYFGWMAEAKKAASDDPTTWSDFENACNRLDIGDMEGLGFMLGEDFFGIDLDNCRRPNHGQVKRWANVMIERLGTYAEISPSERGIKIFGRGQLSSIEATGKTGKSLKPKHLPEQIEFFGNEHCEIAFWNRNRFFVVTGWKVDSAPSALADCSEAANAVFVKLGGGVEAGKSYVPSKETTQVVDRCIKYLERCEPAISGRGGHDATFHAACVCFKFGLSPADAKQVMAWFNDNKCEPRWSERELDHKLEDALSATTNDGAFGSMLLKDSPANVAQKISASTPKTKHEHIPLHDAAKNYLAASKSNETLIDLSGVPEINHAIGGGVERGEMVIVAAMPGHGKSAFSMQCLHVCAEQGMPGLIVSEEMSAMALGKRTLQYVSPVPIDAWKRDAEHVSRQLDAHFADMAPIHVVESCRTPDAVECEVERAVKERGVSVVALDYLQLLAGKGATKYDQVSDASTRIRRIATTHNVLLIALCQLNRELGRRDKCIPRLADLRDSGQLEQDADVVMFLVRPYRLDATRDPAQLQVFVAKNRNRDIVRAAFDVRFEGARQRFAGDTRPDNHEEAFDEYALDPKDAGVVI